jgi:hypothetical protein
MMKATTTQVFLHDQLGRVPVGDFEVTAEQAEALRGFAWITIHDQPAKAAQPKKQVSKKKGK